MQKPFKARSTQPEKVGLNLSTFYFESLMHGENYESFWWESATFHACCMQNSMCTWEKSSIFKGKCLVKAVNFICYFYNSSLMNLILNGRRTILKERHIKWWTHSRILLIFHETVPLISLFGIFGGIFAKSGEKMYFIFLSYRFIKST